MMNVAMKVSGIEVAFPRYVQTGNGQYGDKGLWSCTASYAGMGEIRSTAQARAQTPQNNMFRRRCEYVKRTGNKVAAKKKVKAMRGRFIVKQQVQKKSRQYDLTGRVFPPLVIRALCV